MRILVLSDSHGDRYALAAALEQQPEASTVLFLGDGVDEMEDLASLHPHHKAHIVCGNNDYYADYPAAQVLEIGGKRLFLTHGHRYHVKEGLYTLCCAAREHHADVALFGHTHQPLTDYEDGLYLLNPGSIRRSYGGGRYGYVDITDAGIVTGTLSLR